MLLAFKLADGLGYTPKEIILLFWEKYKTERGESIDSQQTYILRFFDGHYIVEEPFKTYKNKQVMSWIISVHGWKVRFTTGLDHIQLGNLYMM